MNISLYHVSFYCTSLTLHFLQIEGLWQFCVKSINAIFPTFAHFMSLPQFGNSTLSLLSYLVW